MERKEIEYMGLSFKEGIVAFNEILDYNEFSTIMN
jgi:hypothetical protein